MEHLCCKDCLTLLQSEDGHVLCPACLGVDHLRDALIGNSCTDCMVMPRAVKVARLVEFEDPPDWASSSAEMPAGQPQAHGKRSSSEAQDWPRKRRKADSQSRLSTKVDSMSSELAQMKALLQNLQSDAGRTVVVPHEHELPLQDDALSVAASDTQFRDDYDTLSSRVSEAGSHASTGSLGTGEDSVSVAIATALTRLGLDVPRAQQAQSSTFFRRQQASMPFAVPPSQEYGKELHACWTDNKAFSRRTSDGRALASMHDADKYGLGHMPAVEPAIASLIVHPEETLRTNARCPRPQCRIMDDLLCKAYDMGARMGRIGNSLSHLMLGLSASLDRSSVDPSTWGLMDASLQAFALMSRELGHLMSTLVQTRCQVWLAQSLLSEPNRWTLRSVPVVPGELFGAAALEALERTAQANCTRRQLVGLRTRPPSRGGSGTTSSSSRGCSSATSNPFVESRLQDYRPVPERRSQGSAMPSRPSRTGQSYQRPLKPSRGQGARRCDTTAGGQIFYLGSTQTLGRPHPRRLGTHHTDPWLSYSVLPPASSSNDHYPRPGHGHWRPKLAPCWPRVL
ncbi:uncharacterized protein LOC110963751 isoform X1 [Acanthochromis polyacanthus]|uniref:uncharacterized protein LOC110963751 isoform X1 n=1 Tax=Acanthochromis polyacanthus TaxID=80966 RepID=UPI0022342897|nr:uncharacterized protein LOC110963751 isoform X1 [Acanthochromis polyacanthus]